VGYGERASQRPSEASEERWAKEAAAHLAARLSSHFGCAQDALAGDRTEANVHVGAFLWVVKADPSIRVQ
jgi:glutathione S-transferase